MAMTVQVLTSELVVPAGDGAHKGETIWLSNLDVAARRGYTPAVYFYRRPTGAADGDFFDADELRSSLAKVLDVFYPFAGRLGVEDGRVVIDCTGDGALFVTARSDDVTLDELLESFAPSTEMRDLFCPTAPSPDPPCVLLMIQVTYLKCGGAVIGTNMHHTALDARGACHFMESWASISSGSPPPPPPSFDHSMLAARDPPVVKYDHPEYNPDPVPINLLMSPTYASAIITLSKTQVDGLRARSSDGVAARASTFRAVVALVWQLVCRARQLPAEEETRLFTMIDMRARMNPPLPAGFFGNAVIRTSVSANVGEITSGPMSVAARKVRAATSHGEDFLRSLVDYLDGVDMEKVPRSGISRAHLRAISWLGMSLSAIDFGWGAPAFMGPALMYYSGFVYVMNAAGKDGGVSLVLSLEPETMPAFRKLLADELRTLDL